MEKHGEGKRWRFSAEYKAEAVRLVGSSGKRIGAIARELGLGETALRRWVQQAEIDAGRGPTGALTTGEREELGQLRRDPDDRAKKPVRRASGKAGAERAGASSKTEGWSGSLSVKYM